MDTTRILNELRAERDRLDRAIAALQKVANASTGTASTRMATSDRKRRMSPAARQRISASRRKWWAQQKKKIAARHQGGLKELVSASSAVKDAGQHKNPVQQ